MNAQGWIEILITISVAVALAWPLGGYVAKVWQGQRTFLDLVLRPLERMIYAACGVRPDRSQGWVGYTFSLLAFSIASFVVLYLILRFQDRLPLDPQGFAGLSPHLAFNTAVSFVTNTNWQSYVPEATVSTFSQMAGLTSHNFLSAAAGVAVAAVMARAFAANRAEGLGNFWADLTRISLYILLPLSIVIALAYVALGVPQSLSAHAVAHTVEGAKQTIALYPTASQEAIKQLGTNGGGIFNANSAHPFENPNAWTNLIEIVSMNTLSYACVFAFGRIVMARRDARAIVAVMALFVLGASAFPQNAGYNPTGTVAALTYYAADAIKAQYLKAPHQQLVQA